MLNLEPAGSSVSSTVSLSDVIIRNSGGINEKTVRFPSSHGGEYED
jgi:hypothetical protein